MPLSVSPPRRGLSATASLYNMRNIPMSAPAHKTVFGGSHHHSASVSGAGVGWRGTRDVEFRMDVFAAADSEHGVTDEEQERMMPPPPFFYPRAVSGQSLAQDAGGGALYPSPKTPMYSQSNRSSMVDVSDAMSTMSATKKSKFRTAMTKSIPRAVSCFACVFS
ncbi:hypothetical protein EXIGLDRAFT_467018 [Exidia glandulosa HHB12029]|uniref:Uncharacterized protein n=1 Tax=Exidia glandulosa HHB12029 TaxID=1314781 RepID=A0A165JZY0_EXIGL|nr:hypothetical protein EXIGLDRAFT_467018 [Exidia glandulosa HHB12029]